MIEWIQTLSIAGIIYIIFAIIMAIVIAIVSIFYTYQVFKFIRRVGRDKED